MAAENVRAYRPPAPSAPRSRVFYTDASSGTQCAGTPLFKSKFPKRGYDGSCVRDRGTPSSEQHSASLTFNQWRQFKAQQLGNVLVTSFYNYGGGAASDNHGCTSSCSPAVEPRTWCGRRDRQKLYSAHPGRSAADTHQSTHGLSAVYYKDREPAHGLQRAPYTSTLLADSRRCQGPLTLHRDTDIDQFVLNRDTDIDRFALHRDTDIDPGALPEPDLTSSQSSAYLGYLSRRDLVACPETASVTVGEHSSPVDKHEPRQVYGAGSRGRDETKTRSPYISRIPSFPTYHLDLKAQVRSDARLSEQSSLPSICETVSFRFHAPHNSGGRSGGAPFTHAPQVPETDMGGTTRTVPRLRVLDPNVMFKYSHKIYAPTLPD